MLITCRSSVHQRHTVYSRRRQPLQLRRSSALSTTVRIPDSRPQTESKFHSSSGRGRSSKVLNVVYHAQRDDETTMKRRVTGLGDHTQSLYVWPAFTVPRAPYIYGIGLPAQYFAKIPGSFSIDKYLNFPVLHARHIYNSRTLDVPRTLPPCCPRTWEQQPTSVQRQKLVLHARAQVSGDDAPMLSKNPLHAETEVCFYMLELRYQAMMLRRVRCRIRDSINSIKEREETESVVSDCVLLRYEERRSKDVQSNTDDRVQCTIVKRKSGIVLIIAALSQ
jgi:hypothetical protein